MLELISQFSNEVGSQRVASAIGPDRSFEEVITLFTFQTRPNSARFQLPLPEPDWHLSAHPALQAFNSLSEPDAPSGTAPICV
jgi:hypothetical protein